MQYVVREMEQGDIDSVARYFIDADETFLRKMGVDADKVPPLDTWQETLSTELEQPYTERVFHFVIWEADGRPVGHSNINKLTFGKEAWAHLHLWALEARKRGHGMRFFRDSVAMYFELFELERLHCEPYALPPAPNRILPKLGFEFIRSHVTVPGMLNFEQEVNSWTLNRKKWQALHPSPHTLVQDSVEGYGFSPMKMVDRSS